MKRKNGWKPIPLSIKIVFVILLIEMVVFLGKRIIVFASGNFPHNIPFTTIKFLATGVLLVAIWVRYNWTWKYAIGYFSFVIIGTVYYVVPLIRLSIIMAQSGKYLSQVYGATFIIISALQVIIESLFFYLIFRKRKYFN